MLATSVPGAAVKIVGVTSCVGGSPGVLVGVDTSVSVSSGRSPSGTNVLSPVAGCEVNVLLGVRVSVTVGKGVFVGVGVSVGVLDGVKVCVGPIVGSGVGGGCVSVDVGVNVGFGVKVSVGG